MNMQATHPHNYDVQPYSFVFVSAFSHVSKVTAVLENLTQ